MIVGKGLLVVVSGEIDTSDVAQTYCLGTFVALVSLDLKGLVVHRHGLVILSAIVVKVRQVDQ